MSGLLLFALLLAAVGLVFWQRRARDPGAPDLEITARVSLAPRAGLALVETGDERLVVAWGEASPRLIARVAPDGRWEMPPSAATEETP